MIPARYKFSGLYLTPNGRLRQAMEIMPDEVLAPDPDEPEPAEPEPEEPDPEEPDPEEPEVLCRVPDVPGVEEDDWACAAPGSV